MVIDYSNEIEKYLYNKTKVSHKQEKILSKLLEWSVNDDDKFYRACQKVWDKIKNIK